LERDESLRFLNVTSGHVAIHRSAIVAPEVEIGDGTLVGPFAVVLAPCSIGRDCWIGPHAVIGTTAEHLDSMTIAAVPPEASRSLDEGAQRRIDELMWFGSHGAGVIIGDRSTVREQTTVHQGTEGPTVLGDDVFVMNKSHISHDAALGDRVRVAPLAFVGAHTWIGADANIGSASAIHQRRTIGGGAMIGMQATVVKDVGPFQLVKGTPARPSGVNVVGMTRLGFTESDIAALRGYYEDRGGWPTVFDVYFHDWERARTR
jgi:UDP-N-acetylglucosamine acyltransferase